MKELYLEVFSNVSDSGICFVPLETLIVLFLYEYCEEPPLLITLVHSESDTRPRFRIRLPEVLFEILDEEDIDLPGNLCRMPRMVVGETCIAGLCSVLRRILTSVDEKHFLLGFKQGCLYACAESSVWTKFCEVDIIESTNELFSRTEWETTVTLPKDVARFEAHMKQPVKAHNIQKQKQDAARNEGIFIKKHSPDSRLDVIHDLEHVFSEGHKMTLADLILFPCFHLMFQLLGGSLLREALPLTYKWYENLLGDKRVRKCVKFITDIRNVCENEIHVNYVTPEVPCLSLYKSEERTSRKKRQIYTRQDAIESVLKKVDDIDTEGTQMSEDVFGQDVHFDWSDVPTDIQLEGSAFPSERLTRKSQQLSNMVKAVMKVARPSDRVVDFCSGSGYLGLILAHCLPTCTVILLENKEESLKRARKQATKLGLSNVFFCQGNIDYFKGAFEVGVSLHACGAATDLVIEKCIRNDASFVCCPCCYGSIRPNHMIRYPRSKAFKASSLTAEEYATLAHSADQTYGEDNEKSVQGKRCMTVIDIDRCLSAKENGYTVHLSTLEPPSCTPKNSLLIGIAPSNKLQL